MDSYKLATICAVLFALAFNLSSHAQLPKRPAPSEPEESVTPEIALKVDEYFERYISNYETINRFVGVATLERTTKRKGEPLELTLMYFVHAQDFKRNVRRLDTLEPVIANLQDGTQKPSFLKLITIESEKGAWQYQKYEDGAKTPIERISKKGRNSNKNSGPRYA